MGDLLDSNLIRVVAAAAVAGVLIKVLWPMLFPPAGDPLQLKVRCPICGWRGTVGKYNRKCAKCGATTLEPQK